jgi:hypothetical protein
VTVGSLVTGKKLDGGVKGVEHEVYLRMRTLADWSSRS